MEKLWKTNIKLIGTHVQDRAACIGCHGGNMLITGKNGTNVNVKTLNLSKKDNVNVKTLNIKANYLVEKFEKLGYTDARKSYHYFVRIFRTLPECTIWGLYERATQDPMIDSAIKYFIGACRNQMTLVK